MQIWLHNLKFERKNYEKKSFYVTSFGNDII